MEQRLLTASVLLHLCRFASFSPLNLGYYLWLYSFLNGSLFFPRTIFLRLNESNDLSPLRLALLQVPLLLNRICSSSRFLSQLLCLVSIKASVRFFHVRLLFFCFLLPFCYKVTLVKMFPRSTFTCFLYILSRGSLSAHIIRRKSKTVRFSEFGK